MAVHHSAEQWRAWLAEFEQSEMTVSQFCQSLGVSDNTFYKWRQRLKADHASSPLAVEFVPVALPSSELTIELPAGAIARVSNDVESLRPLVELLIQLGAEQ